MIKKLIGGLALSLVVAGTANAYSISIDAPDEVRFGDTFTIDLVANFPGGFIAGGLQLLYDPSLVSVLDFSTTLPVDSALSCPGAPLCPVDPPGVETYVWGQFLTDLLPVDTVGAVIATITLQAADLRGPLPTIVLDLVDASAFTGGWFGAGFSDLGGPPALNGASIAVIPLPAAAWLMIGGLGALMGFRRR